MKHTVPQSAAEPDAAERLRLRMEELDARFAPERECSARAMKIVDRVLPKLAAQSAYFNPEAFIAGAGRHADRGELYRSIKARLLAKAGVRADWWLGDEPAARSSVMVPPL